MKQYMTHLKEESYLIILLGKFHYVIDIKMNAEFVDRVLDRELCQLGAAVKQHSVLFVLRGMVSCFYWTSVSISQ